jgi:hypothetical protein
MIENSFNSDNRQLHDLFTLFPRSLKSFLDEKEWISKIKEIKKNTSGLDSFTKRFFGWFNMFRVVKYLNYAHMTIVKKSETNSAAAELLRYIGEINIPFETDALLKRYRELEKDI